MKKHFVPSSPRTPADEIRKILDEAEIVVTGLRSAGPDAIELLHLIDGTLDSLAELEAAGMDVRPERSRLETVQRRLARHKRRFVSKVGRELDEERAAVQPERERWWWYLDETVAQERRKRLRRFMIWGAAALVLLVVLGVVYNTFFKPPPDYHHRLTGENLAVEGNLEGALDEFETANALAPDNPRYLIWLGVLRAELGEPGAEAALEDAQRIYGDRGSFFVARAEAYRLIGKYGVALDDAEQAILEAPDAGWYYCERAMIHLALGDRDAALADFERAAELGEQAGDHQLEAYAHYQRGVLSLSPPATITPTP